MIPARNAALIYFATLLVVLITGAMAAWLTDNAWWTLAGILAGAILSIIGLLCWPWSR